MAEDWTFVPKVNSDKWQEEEDEDVKENWDDDDDDDQDDDLSKSSSTTNDQCNQNTEQTNKKTITITNKKKMKALKEKIAKKEEIERKHQQQQQQHKPKTAEELLAEKLEKQRLIEENDLALAKETFGLSGSNTTDLIVALNSIRLATKDDFDDFYKALDEKLSIYHRSPHYFIFLDNLFRSLASGLDTDDIRKLTTTLTALYNEKIKLQKQEKKGKKSKKLAPTILMERDSDYLHGSGVVGGGGGGNQYDDDFDDFI